MVTIQELIDFLEKAKYELGPDTRVQCAEDYDMEPFDPRIDTSKYSMKQKCDEMGILHI